MFYDEAGDVYYSDNELALAFGAAEIEGVRYLAIIRSQRATRYVESAFKTNSEEHLLRYLRYEGLRPDGTPHIIVRFFDVMRDFKTQMAVQPAATLTNNMSAAAQEAYARYVAELAKKYMPAAQKNGRGNLWRGGID